MSLGLWSGFIAAIGACKQSASDGGSATDVLAAGRDAGSNWRRDGGAAAAGVEVRSGAVATQNPGLPDRGHRDGLGHRDGHTHRVKSNRELISAAHLNYIGSFRKLAEHSSNGEIRSVRSVFAFVTGLPFPLFNGCVVVEPTSAMRLRTALPWLRERRVRIRSRSSSTSRLISTTSWRRMDF